MEKKKSFYDFMQQEYGYEEPHFEMGLQYAKDLHQYFEDSPFGDLAMDMKRDVDFPEEAVNYAEIRRHIRQKFAEHCGYHTEYSFPVTASAVLGTLKEAFRAYILFCECVSSAGIHT